MILWSPGVLVKNEITKNINGKKEGAPTNSSMDSMSGEKVNQVIPYTLI